MEEREVARSVWFEVTATDDVHQRLGLSWCDRESREARCGLCPAVISAASAGRTVFPFAPRKTSKVQLRIHLEFTF